MKRDMMDTVKKVMGQDIIPSRYDLDADEMTTLMRMVLNQKKLAEAIEVAFDYGFVLGSRAARSGRIKNL